MAGSGDAKVGDIIADAEEMVENNDYDEDMGAGE